MSINIIFEELNPETRYRAHFDSIFLLWFLPIKYQMFEKGRSGELIYFPRSKRKDK